VLLNVEGNGEPGLVSVLASLAVPHHRIQIRRSGSGGAHRTAAHNARDDCLCR
jgi:hypothetical protein